MTAAAVAETLAREYPKTVVLTDGAHLVLRAAAEPDAVAIVAGADGCVAGTARLTWSTDPAGLTVAVTPEFRGRRLGTWMLLDGVHLAAALGAAGLAVAAGAGDEGLRRALRRLDFVERDAGRFVKTLHHGWTDF